jgi:trimethylamine---corrinoid protein Co-methyltransferase
MGHEKTLTALLPALAGANVIYGLGNTETGVTMDYGQMVMDNEFAGLIKYTLEGIAVNDETLAVDVIHEVGPSGDFLSHDHTFKHMRKAQTHTELIDRRIRGEWQALGSKSIYERSWEKAFEILASHRPQPMPAGVQETLRSIVRDTERELGLETDTI